MPTETVLMHPEINTLLGVDEREHLPSMSTGNISKPLLSAYGSGRPDPCSMLFIWLTQHKSQPPSGKEMAFRKEIRKRRPKMSRIYVPHIFIARLWLVGLHHLSWRHRWTFCRSAILLGCLHHRDKIEDQRDVQSFDLWRVFQLISLGCWQSNWNRSQIPLHFICKMTWVNPIGVVVSFTNPPGYE